MGASMTDIHFSDYIAAVDRLLTVNCLDEFKHCLMNEIRALLPFDCFVGGLARVSGDQVSPELMVQHEFPNEYLDAIRGPGNELCSPVLSHWLGNPTPVMFDFTQRCDRLSSATLTQMRRFELRNVLAHGHYTPNDGLLTYFSLHRLPEPITELHRLMMARLIPPMHCAISRIHAQAKVERQAHGGTQDFIRLSTRQQQIAEWLIRGKTNWEISRIAGTSEANVKYHLSKLMRMFEVSSRASLAFQLSQGAEAGGTWPMRVEQSVFA